MTKDTTKGKILIIHGFGSSPTIIKERQSVNLCNALESMGYELEFPRAPTQMGPGDFPPSIPDDHDCTKNDVYSWWSMFDEDHVDGYLDKFWSTFNDYPEKEKVVGIIGFSQGGASAVILASNAQKLFPNAKFAVQYGGFIAPFPGKPAGLKIYGDGISIPLLSVYGDNDDVVHPDATLEIYEKLAHGEKDTVVHQDMHSIGDHNGRTTPSVIEWIRKYT